MTNSTKETRTTSKAISTKADASAALPTTYKIHPLAMMFPPMAARAKAALREDIRRHGQQIPAVLLEGAILDGRHRAEICAELGLELKTSEFDSRLSPETFVWSVNAVRRDLSQSQLGMVAAALANLPRQGGRPRKSDDTNIDPENQPGKIAGLSDDLPMITIRDAAKTIGCSERTVRSARTVEQSGIAELKEAVRSDRLAVDKAAKIARLSPEVQAAKLQMILGDSDEQSDSRKSKRIEDQLFSLLLKGKPLVGNEPVEQLRAAKLRLFNHAYSIVTGCVEAIKDEPYPASFAEFMNLVPPCKAISSYARRT